MENRIFVNDYIMITLLISFACYALTSLILAILGFRAPDYNGYYDVAYLKWEYHYNVISILQPFCLLCVNTTMMLMFLKHGKPLSYDMKASVCENFMQVFSDEKDLQEINGERKLADRQVEEVIAQIMSISNFDNTIFDRLSATNVEDT